VFIDTGVFAKQEQSRRQREKDNMGKEVETPSKVCVCVFCVCSVFLNLNALSEQRKVREADERKKVGFIFLHWSLSFSLFNLYYFLLQKLEEEEAKRQADAAEYLRLNPPPPAWRQAAIASVTKPHTDDTPAKEDKKEVPQDPLLAPPSVPLRAMEKEEKIHPMVGLAECFPFFFDSVLTFR
jgi:hypothetical protein